MARAEAAITHTAPGRVRVRVSNGTRRQQSEVLNAVSSLSGQGGITSVVTNSRTGSALVQFDPEDISPEEVLTIVQGAHTVLQDVLPPQAMTVLDRSTSDVASAVRETFAHANRRVLNSTRGSVDLRMLAPIGLAGLSLRQLLREGPKLEAIPWYVLGYYAFDTFVKLHADGAAQPGD